MYNEKTIEKLNIGDGVIIPILVTPFNSVPFMTIINPVHFIIVLGGGVIGQCIQNL